MFEELTRLNARQRKEKYPQLVARDDEKCNKCGRKPPNEVKKLIIHRIDNQGDYSDLSKLQLLCYRCNYLKNPRIKERKPLDRREGEGKEEDEDVVVEKIDLEYVSSLDVNRKQKPLLMPYVEGRLDKSPKGVDYSDLVASIALKLDIVTRTAEKWLIPYCSSEGPYETFKDGKTRYVRRKKP
ncbi:HNH endonuclease [candidate division KSB1 bacterium]|nr:HNH endonuclease [candidate division KSB1 bacterium]